MSTDFTKLLRVLAAGGVDFIIVGLIQVKRAAGRVKDLEAIAELEAILEERNH